MEEFVNIFTILILLGVGLYLLLGVAIIVTALVERRPLKFLLPLEDGDPELQRLLAIANNAFSRDRLDFADDSLEDLIAPYPDSRVRAATLLGFSAPQVFKHAKGGTYNTKTALMLSPTQETLAVIRWGTIASLRTNATLLYSLFEDGRILLTSDRPVGSRIPDIQDDLVYNSANFNQLYRRHQLRLEESSKKLVLMQRDDLLVGLNQILDRKVHYLFEHREARWADEDKSSYKSTLKGAIKIYAQTFSTKHVDQSLTRSTP
jgi:hypothetical protein